MKPVYTAGFVHAAFAAVVSDAFKSLYITDQKPQDIIKVMSRVSEAFKWGIAECTGTEQPPPGSVLICALAVPMDDVEPLVTEISFYVYPTTVDSIVNYHR